MVSLYTEKESKIAVFPDNLIAGVFGFSKEEFFGVEDEGERQPAQVKF